MPYLFCKAWWGCWNSPAMQQVTGWISKELWRKKECARFCLILVVDACLWYVSIHPLDNDWPKLQKLFHLQFSNLGHTQEELFQRWKSFHFDETNDTIDSYMLWLKQCAQMLGYSEGQMLNCLRILYPADTIICYLAFKTSEKKWKVQNELWQRKNLTIN